MVFVYHGGMNGINPMAAVMLEDNQAGAQFGASVAGGGMSTAMATVTCWWGPRTMTTERLMKEWCLSTMVGWTA